MQCPAGKQHDGDKKQLANLYANVEKDKCYRNRLLWQTHFGQCAGKTKAVQQAKDKSD